MLNPLSRLAVRTGCALLAWALCGPSILAGDPGPAWSFSPEQLRPFWLSETMEGESVLFVQSQPVGPPRASLLFAPTRVLSVSTSSGQVTYQEGRDYLWKPGSREIVLPAGSRILFKRPQDLRRPSGSQAYKLPHRDGQGEILFGGGHEYHDMQTTVTYEHAANAWSGPRPSVPQVAAKDPDVVHFSTW